MHSKFLLVVPAILAFCAVAKGQESNWTRFQNGGATSTANRLPTQWSPTKNIAWEAEIPGYGQSTPIVAHQQVVVTSTSGANKDQYHVVSYSLNDGMKQWQVDLENPSPFKNTPMVSRAAPSAVASEQGFVAFFEGGIVTGIDKQGKQTWTKNLVELYGPIEARHGLSASLESNRECVFVWVERMEDPYVLALDPATGEEIWKAPGVGATSWASPRLVPVDGGEHLVCSASGRIVGMHPKTGERLWEFEDIGNNTSCTPMPIGEGQFLIGASDGRGETAPGNSAGSNGLIQITKQAEGTYAASFKWRAEKATSTFGSPIAAGDSALIVNRTGVLYRFDLETGEQMSAKRTSAGGIWATPLVAGDKVYLFGYKGTTSVLSLEEGKEIAVNRCWPEESEDANRGFASGGDTLYAATPTSQFLIIRRGDRLFAIGE